MSQDSPYQYMASDDMLPKKSSAQDMDEIDEDFSDDEDFNHPPPSEDFTQDLPSDDFPISQKTDDAQKEGDEAVLTASQEDDGDEELEPITSFYDEASKEKRSDAFRTIGEVAKMLRVPVHIVRFWEGRLNKIKPIKGQGGRRYYRPEDIEFLGGLRHLLYVEGYTIKGVHRLIRQKGADFVRDKADLASQHQDERSDQILYGLISDLEHIQKRLKDLTT